MRQAGLSDRITILSEDYRDLKGSFDKLVSIEMIEAVGLHFLDTYFRICSERLKPAGRMLLQSITIADRNYEQARHSVDFIQKYIFPGGALPSCAAILSSVSRVTDLQLTGLQDIGLDYARTLQIWRERFLHRVQDVRRLGYPDEFVRMWEWYLAYCEGGFLERAISAVQVVFDKPECRLSPAGVRGMRAGCCSPRCLGPGGLQRAGSRHRRRRPDLRRHGPRPGLRPEGSLGQAGHRPQPLRADAPAADRSAVPRRPPGRGHDLSAGPRTGSSRSVRRTRSGSWTPSPRSSAKNWRRAAT